MKNKILITGGTGFIGQNLIKKLLKDQTAEIFIVSKYKAKSNQLFVKDFSDVINKLVLIEADIVKKGALDSVIKNIRTIIHLAAKTQFNSSRDSLYELFNTNVLGTRLLLESAVKYNVKKFIFLSTSGVYGNRIKSMTMDESHKLNPLNPYTKSKFDAEKVTLSYYQKYRFPVVILRPSNVYGSYQYPPWMIPLFINRLLSNQPILLNFEGRPKRDWIYAEDLVNSIVTVINHSSNEIFGEIFNVGMGKTISNLDVASIIVKQLKKSRKLIRLKESGPVESLENMAVSNKINRILNWKPFYSIERGLRNTIEWYKENKNLMPA